MSLLPRSATYPFLSGSPRGRPSPSSFSFLGARGSSADGRDTAMNRGLLASGSNASFSASTSRKLHLGGGSWKGLLMAVALLYGLAFITVPAVYSRVSGEPRGAPLEPGLRAAGPRRMGLQTLEWPDTGLAQRHFGSKNAAQPRVEFRDAGTWVRGWGNGPCWASASASRDSTSLMPRLRCRERCKSGASPRRLGLGRPPPLPAK